MCFLWYFVQFVSKYFFLDFCPEDRVVLIGISSCPWESDQKLLQQVYQKYLIIPRPNYSSRFYIWKHFLNQHMTESWQFDFGMMSKISDGYTCGESHSCLTIGIKNVIFCLTVVIIIQNKLMFLLNNWIWVQNTSFLYRNNNKF